MAINFDGANDFVQIGTSAGTVFDNMSSFSAAFWFRADTLSTAPTVGNFIVSKSTVAEDTGWQIVVNGAGANGDYDRRLRVVEGFTVSGGRWGTASGSISTGTWYHGAVTYSSHGSSTPTVNVYLNGSTVGMSTITACGGNHVSDANANLIIGIGADGSSRPFDGQLEDLRIYNRILSANEVATLANGYRGPLGGEVLWLPLFEPAAALSTGTANVFDMSGNGNHGTPQNGGNYVGAAIPIMSGWIP